MPSWSGSILLPSPASPAKVAARIAEGLRKAEASWVALDGERIEFTGGMFRAVWNWNLLVSFGSGEIRVDQAAGRVFYRLHLTQLMIVAATLSLFMGVAMAAEDMTAAIVATPCFWVFLVGGNLLIGVTRFREFLEGAVRGGPFDRA